MPAVARRRVVFLLLGLVVLSVLITPLRRELYAGDETKYAQVIREMRSGGQIFLPTLEGTPFTHKPPVHFWILYALTFVFGAYSVWSYVIPSIVAFVVLLAAVWRMGGPVAAYVCATALMIWGSAQTARMDLTFTALIAWAAWWLLRFFEREEFRALLIAAALLGVAVVVKGPMAPVIGLALFAFEWFRRRRVPRGNYLPAILTLIGIPLLWLIPALIIGGEAYANELLVKQTVRRAVGSWVHRSPPWFYVTHAPGYLFPWFVLFAVALISAYRRRDESVKFYVSWIFAVFVPYTIVSSKLDVYMMALIPPVAVVIGALLEKPFGRVAHWANVAMLALLAVVGVAAYTIGPRFVKPEDRELIDRPDVMMMFVVLAASAIIALLVALWKRDAVVSTLALGLVPLAALIYVGAFLTPVANDEASSRRLVRSLAALNVPPESIACYTCPHLWSRDMPRQLERVRYVDADDLRRNPRPEVIATSRRYSKDIAFALEGYRHVAEVRMIGKWFDVYRR